MYSQHLNVETKPKRGGGETEKLEKWLIAPQKLVLGHNSQITDLHKVLVSSFLVLMEMKKLCQGKMALAPQKCVLEQNSELAIPLKFESPIF